MGGWPFARESQQAKNVNKQTQKHTHKKGTKRGSQQSNRDRGAEMDRIPFVLRVVCVCACLFACVRACACVCAVCVLVDTGGLLFEHWFSCYGSYTSARLVAGELKGKNKTNTKLTQETNNSIISEHKTVFYAHLMQALATMGASVTKQQFYLTFMQEYKGLSRTGCRLLSAINVALPLTTYDRIKAREAKLSNARARSVQIHPLNSHSDSSPFAV